MSKPKQRLRRRRKSVIAIRPGAPPGTIEVDPSAPRPVIRAVEYGPDRLSEQEIADVSTLTAPSGDGSVTWINVDGIGDADTIRRLQRTFGLHPLAVEDVVNVGQRAKVDLYDDQLFCVLRMPSGEDAGVTEQVCLFLKPGLLVTFQEKAGDCFDPVRERIRSGRARIRSMGPDYLMYALIDALVDAYFPVLDRVGERLQAMEDRVLHGPSGVPLAAIQELRHDLRAIRRANLPHHDLLTVLLRQDTQFVTDTTRIYLRDCLDHAVRVSESVDSHREESSDLMHAQLATASNRMNEVMKVLTIMAAIFIPLGFIAGVYGMNFDGEVSRWNMPELHWRWGYPGVLVLMGAVAGGLLLYFRKRKWF